MVAAEFSFQKFAEQDFYNSLNALLVEEANITPEQRVIDLACGTGAVTRLILERLRGARESVVIAVDHSALALREAKHNLEDAWDAAVQYVQSGVEHLSDSIKESVDTIVFCNAIHYIPDKNSLISQLSKVLRPGGTFAFNTSFFDGGHPPETEHFYRRWMFKALRILKKEYGLMPYGEKTEARRHLTPEQYEDVLKNQGFYVATKKIREINVPIDGWLTISQFEDWIKGVMPGVPLDKASAALKKGVTQVFQDLDITFVQRNWLDIVAVKCSGR